MRCTNDTPVRVSLDETAEPAHTAPGFVPTAEQQAAVDAVVEALYLAQITGTTQVRALIGNAGSGKTSVVCRALIPRIRGSHEMVVSAFTHRACAVVRRKLEDAGMGKAIKVLTAASLLGFREVHTDEGREPRFEQAGESKLDGFRLVIVDEASMLPAAYWKALQTDADPGTLILAVGDDAQLPPVGNQIGKPAPALDLPEDQIIRLTHIHRNAGPILDLATAVRKAHPGTAPVLRSRSSEHGEVVVHPHKQAMRREVERVLRENLEAGIDDGFRILAGHNDQVATWNNMCRRIVYGRDAETHAFMPGELLISRNAVFDHMDVGAYNATPVEGASCECTVVSGSRGDYQFEGVPVLGDEKFDCWQLIVSGIGGSQAFEVFAADPADWDQLDALKRTFATNAKDAKRMGTVHGFKANQWWAGYFALRTVFDHKMGPRFASTTHKAQGGEWRDVFVDLPDFEQWRRTNPGEHRALVYTAVTRAQNTLHLLGV